MHTILLYGSEKDMQITHTLLGTIRSADCSALHITGKIVSLIPPQTKDADFLVLDNANVSDLHVKRGIVIFKPGIPIFQNGFNIPEDFFAIVDPSNEEAVAMVRKNCIQTITCGLSQKDTITFSSIDQDKAVVSLQRMLISLDGENIEPCEIPIHFNKTVSDYAILASIAVLLLSGIKLSDQFVLHL